jgi:hypothetical protein
MNNQQTTTGKQDELEPESQQHGPNLKVLYAILAIALAAAIGTALLIVLPFYQRH